jgi:helix-turn-helix protein
VEGETTYTVEEAAARLEESPERVLQMLATGELDGIPPGATVSGEWKVLLPTTVGDVEDQEPPPAEEGPESSPEAEAAPSSGGAEEFVERPGPPPSDAEEPAGFVAPPSAGETPRPGPDEPPGETPREADERVRASAGDSGWTTTKQAAKVLGVSRRSVQSYVRRGLLEAREEGEGVNKAFLISIDSLNALRDRRMREAGEAAKFAETSAEEERTANLYANSGEAIRHAIERVEARTVEATELRLRLELTEQAESTLRAELEEERRRREAAERERDELRRRLEYRQEPREPPVSPAPTQTPTAAGGGPQEAREATQSAAETLRGPDPRPPSGGAQADQQVPYQPGRRRVGLWRRVFGRR